MKKIKYAILLFLLLLPLKVTAAVPEIDSKNAVLLNLTNNEIIYEKDKDTVVKVASLQKIMTALVAIEKVEDLNSTFEVTPGLFNSLDSDLMVLGLRSGDVVTYNDLLYCTLLKSGADCAYSLAIGVSGSEEEYLKLMNNKAKELGLNNTSFKNSTGLDAEGQQSTVNEMAILLKYALNNKDFKRIISTPNYNVLSRYNIDGPVSKAKSMGLDYFLGGKTGYTEEAGLCLASYASYNDVDYLLVTAGADYGKKNQNFIDQKTIYDYFTTNYSFNTLVHKGDIITTIKTIYNEKIEIKAKKDVVMYLNNSIFNSDLDIEYDGIKVLNRKNNKGDKIGTYTIKYKDKVLYQEDVLNPIKVHFRLSKKLLIVFLVIDMSILIHIIIRHIKRKNRRKKVN